MRNLLTITIAIFSLLIYFTSCGNANTSSNQLVDSLKNVVASQKVDIKNLADTISMLKFPADQRFAKAVDAFNNDNLDEAETLFNEIKELFPLSEEAKQCDIQIQKIADKRKELIAEQERIKALGFKALTSVTNATIDGVSVSFTGISVGKDFTHDSYSSYGGSEWFYNTADKGNKFITCSMSATTKESNPNLPTLALYSINGDKLKYEGTFKIEFARWDDYGSYLGNEPDLHNDFAKVNTVQFKLGCEVSEDILYNPYMVVLKLANTQIRNYDRFSNPPYWYSGDAEYPYTLGIEDFTSNYKVIRIANL
ncbi:MAG: hypothetical protein IK092_06210 [Muribaculaceae bacterium]|nr:hypothetical protein [Muribaculaceae bacterium]